MRTCRLCPASIQPQYVVCYTCLPRWAQWRQGKRNLRHAAHVKAAERIEQRSHRPWAGIFDKPGRA